MHLQASSRKPLQTRKMKEEYGEVKESDEVSIPDSWNLSQVQRNFIESMIDKKTK